MAEPQDNKPDSAPQDRAPAERPPPPKDSAPPADDATPFEPPYMDAIHGSDDFPSPPRRKR